MAATAGSGKKGGGGLFKKIAPGFGCDIFSVIEKTRDDPVDIGIQDRHALIKSKRGDGCCRVWADTGKGTEGWKIGWDIAAKLRRYRLRCSVQVTGARVISEALPEFENIGFGGRRECGDIGKTAHPSLKIRDHGGDGGLLQHELGDQYGVGRGGSAPWEVASVGAEPSAERGVKIGSHGIGYHLDTHEGLRSKIGNVFTKSTAFLYRRAHAGSG